MGKGTFDALSALMAGKDIPESTEVENNAAPEEPSEIATTSPAPSAEAVTTPVLSKAEKPVINVPNHVEVPKPNPKPDNHQEKEKPKPQNNDRKNTRLHELSENTKHTIGIGEPWIRNNFSDENFTRIVDNLKFRESGGHHDKTGHDKHGNPYYGQLQLGGTQLGLMGCPTHKETIHVKVKDKDGHFHLAPKLVDRVDAGFLNDFLNNKNGVQDIVNDNWLKYNAGMLVQTGADKYVGKDIYFGKEGHRQFLCNLTPGEALTAVNLSGPGSANKHTGLIGFLQASDKDYHPKKGHDANSSDGSVTIAQYIMVGMVAEFNTDISFDDIRKKTNSINQKLHHNPDYNVSTALAGLVPPARKPNNYVGVHPDDMVHLRNVQETMNKVNQDYLNSFGQQPLFADLKGNDKKTPSGRDLK